MSEFCKFFHFPKRIHLFLDNSVLLCVQAVRCTQCATTAHRVDGRTRVDVNRCKLVQDVTNWDKPKLQIQKSTNLRGPVSSLGGAPCRSLSPYCRGPGLSPARDPLLHVITSLYVKGKKPQNYLKKLNEKHQRVQIVHVCAVAQIKLLQKCDEKERKKCSWWFLRSCAWLTSLQLNSVQLLH